MTDTSYSMAFTCLESLFIKMVENSAVSWNPSWTSSHVKAIGQRISWRMDPLQLANQSMIVAKTLTNALLSFASAKLGTKIAGVVPENHQHDYSDSMLSNSTTGGFKVAESADIALDRNWRAVSPFAIAALNVILD